VWQARRVAVQHRSQQPSVGPRPAPAATKQGSRMAGGVTSTKREPPAVALDGDHSRMAIGKAEGQRLK